MELKGKPLSLGAKVLGAAMAIGSLALKAAGFVALLFASVDLSMARRREVMGYIILFIFVLWVISALETFLFGYTKGRAKEQAEQKEDALRKVESDRAFEAEKENVSREVFGDAEKKRGAGFPAVLAGIVLTLSTVSCVTTKIEWAREIPTVDFPVFPPPDCVEYDEEANAVSMPLWY
jgi:hypothetical protein